MTWTKVEDDLPEVGRLCWFNLDGEGTVFIGDRFKGVSGWTWREAVDLNFDPVMNVWSYDTLIGDIREITDILAWSYVELPEPPKE